MFASGLIVFRETLEAAIIVAIVLAATRAITGRAKWITLGIGGGVLAAGLIALLAQHIANMADGVGQELLNAGILFSAVALLTWHIVWMSRHGKQLAEDMRAVGHSVASGQKHMSVLAIVIGLAVMREGAEVVLLLQGLSLGTAAATSAGLLLGAVMGLLSGVLLGWLMYQGFLKLPIKQLFSTTNLLLVLIAAGLAARAVNYLLQAGYWANYGDQVWDTSSFISDHSILGQLLAALVGYVAQPNEAQLFAYGATMIMITSLLAWQSSRRWHKTVAIGLGALALGGSLLAASTAHASTVKSPYVTQGELELEYKGEWVNDNDAAEDGAHEHEFGVAYGVTDFWKTEFEAEFEKEPGHSLKNTALTSENVFQLADRGQYWLDPAIYFEASIGRNDEPDALSGGLIAAKDFGKTSHLLNLFLKGEIGDSAEEDVMVQYRWQSRYHLVSWAEPGVELFGDTKGRSGYRNQELSVGPALFGKVPHTGMKYELGYQFGTTSATADGALRWKLEYEFHF
jgi:high-affinity iron transporter